MVPTFFFEKPLLASARCVLSSFLRVEESSGFFSFLCTELDRAVLLRSSKGLSVVLELITRGGILFSSFLPGFFFFLFVPFYCLPFSY